MKLIIMAAGVGSRLSEISSGKPKCLIDAGGETLIKRLVRISKDYGVRDITVITGFESNFVREEIGDEVDYVHNPFYSVTNSISSLWLAREKLTGDVILMNGDLCFEPKLFGALLNQKKSAVMLSDSTRIETADYRFCFRGDQITHYGKHLSDQETDGEYVGMARIDSSFIKQFRTRLEKLISQGHINHWWEDVLYSHIPEGTPIYHFNVAGIFWTEIDDPRDFTRLQNWLHGGRQGSSQVIPPHKTPSIPRAKQPNENISLH